MPQTPIKTNPQLGIHLDGGHKRYSPGDVITGHVMRQTPAVTTGAVVTISFRGRAKSKMTESRNENRRVYRGRFNFFDIHEKLFEGPLHIASDGKSQGVSWPFTVVFPAGIETPGWEGQKDQSQSFLSLRAEDVKNQPLPPTVWTKGGNISFGMEGFVEYYLEAEMQLAQHGSTSVEKVYATLPLEMVQMSPDPPIANFKLLQSAFSQSVSSQRLVPGMEDADLSFVEKTQKLFKSSKVPNFAFNALVDVPSVVQLENPNPMPFRVRLHPVVELTTEALRDVPRTARLKSASMEIRTDWLTKCPSRCGTRQARNSRKTGLAVDESIMGLKDDIYVPCTVDAAPLDLGALIDLRIGRFGRVGSKKMSTTNLLCPDVTTYNIQISHRLKWDIRITIAGENVKLSGEHALTVLEPSDDGNRAGSVQKSEPQKQRSEAWIQQPAEDNPPTFEESQVDGRAVEKMGPPRKSEKA